MRRSQDRLRSSHNKCPTRIARRKIRSSLEEFVVCNSQGSLEITWALARRRSMLYVTAKPTKSICSQLPSDVLKTTEEHVSLCRQSNAF